MTRYPWVLAAMALAAGPWGCVVVAEGNGTPGGTGHHGSGGGSGFGGSGTGGGGGAGGGSAASGDTCNPVTGAGCPADGSTCDVDENGHFGCFPPPNDVNVCGACDNQLSFCGGDLTCVFPADGNVGACYRYCCNDADCGAGGKCDLAFGAQVLSTSDPSDKVGLCVVSATNEDPSCGPPALSPSGGACVGGFSGGHGSGSSDAGPPTDSGSSADSGSASEDGGQTEPGDGGTAMSFDGGGFGDGGHGGRHPHDAG